MNDGPLSVELQLAVNEAAVPPVSEWSRWARAAVTAARGVTPHSRSLTIRLVDSDESERLNSTYRHKSGATNVLAFVGAGAARSLPEGEHQLGDLVICLPLVHAEASEQGKDPVSHMAHLTIHGTLHLLGYDHGDARSAESMEKLETTLMAELGYADPYAMRDN